MTAIERGASDPRRSTRPPRCCSRAWIAAIDAVGRLDRETHADGAFLELCARLFQPASANTLSICGLSGNVSAMNVVMPFDRGDDGEVLEQQRAEAAALLVVLRP